MNTARRGWLVPALVLALVVCVAAAGFLFYRLARFDADASAGGQGSSAHDTERAQAVAEQFSLRMDDIDGKDLKGYSDAVMQLLTTKGKADFDKQFQALQQVTLDPKTKGTGRVLATAVSDIDADSAAVMVVHDSVVTNSQGSTGRHYRWLVSLQKIDGRWLVDDFTPVE